MHMNSLVTCRVLFALALVIELFFLVSMNTSSVKTIIVNYAVCRIHAQTIRCLFDRFLLAALSSLA